MVTIVRACQRVAREYKARLTSSAILQICQNVGYRFRQRVLGPVETIHLFLLQVLNGNTACAHLPHLSPLDFTDSAYCQARSRLPLAVFGQLLTRAVDAMRRATDAFGRWRGHRVFHLDGSSFSMPDTSELAAQFHYPSGQPEGCGFPTAHLMAMFDAATGFIIDVATGPWHTSDLAQAAGTHPHLQAGDVLVADRAFGTFAHLALLWQRGVHAVCRINQRTITCFRVGRPHCDPRKQKPVKGRPRSRWIARLGRDDQVVDWFLPKGTPRWLTAGQAAGLPATLRVRELRYRVTQRGFRTRQVCLVTTLLDPHAYPREALMELYGCRWQVEVNLRHLKQTMGMDVLHCKTVEGVLKELYMFALVYNLVRCVMLESARQQGVEPDWISFVDALRWLCAGGSGVPLDRLQLVPRRPDRAEPRVVKRRPKPYKRMTKPRHQLRKELELKQLKA